MPDAVMEIGNVQQGFFDSAEIANQYGNQFNMRNFVRLMNATRDQDGAIDEGLFRPTVFPNGRTYVKLRNVRGSDKRNAWWDVSNDFTAILSRDAWIQYDTAIRRAARDRLRFVSDLMGANLTLNQNLFGRTHLAYRMMGEAGEAVMGMDPMMRGKADRPTQDLVSMPLPLIWCDFWFSARDLAISGNSDNTGFRVDTIMAEQATRRVMEKVEDLHLGNLPVYTFGQASLYGVRNFPERNTKSITLPSTPGWTPNTLLTEILEMREQGVDDKMYGPWGLYFSRNWNIVLDQDYSDAKGTDSLRQRLKTIGDEDGNRNVAFIRSLDRLTGWQIIMIQMTSDVIRTVIGMPLQTYQWQVDPWSQNFRVMLMQLPQFHHDINDNVGIIHATAV